MLGRARRQSYEVKCTSVFLIDRRYLTRVGVDNALVGGVNRYILEIDYKDCY